MRDNRAGIQAHRTFLRLVVLAMLAVTSASLSSTRVGNFCYRGNLELLNNRTIDVSDTMVALSSVFYAKGTRDSTVITSESPSIFLVIDNSGSMQTSPGNDSSGIRFTIANAYIDSVRVKFPDAEVGLAVFGSYLYFDPNDRPYFAVCSAQTNGAYVPLLKLDSVYSAYSNQTGYQILKSLLAVSTYDTGADQYVGLTYQPTDTVLRGKGCNLTAGFDAVKSAMASATASRCSQYVILFSDGEANAPGGAATWYFRDSVKNDPTTITVFFPGTATLQNSVGLREIDTMTHNIRVNGYDLSEPADSGCTQRSNYWSCNFGNVMSLLTLYTWDIIKTVDYTLLSQITVNGFLTTQRIGDSCFHFDNFIPLTGQITPVSVSTVYVIIKNSVRVGDTTISTSYYVRTMPHANPTWSPSQADSFQVWTWDRDFVFRYNNAPIQYIADTMDSVELYFTFDSGTAKYGYDNVYIDLYNNIAPIDHQRIQLARVSDRVFSGKFKRQVSITANINEFPPILQYRGANDSVVAVFRNREQLTTGKVQLPLDTFRVAMPLTAPSAASLVIYSDSLPPGAGNVAKPNPPQVLTMAAGSIDTLAALVFDQRGVFLPQYLTDTESLAISWTAVSRIFGDTLSNRIFGASGAVKYFAPIRAYDTVMIIASLDSTIRDTVLVVVPPGPTKNHIVLENSSSYDIMVPDPCNTLVIPATGTSASVYAIIRDRFDNFVDYSTTTQWISTDTSIINVNSGNTMIGEGIVTRVAGYGQAMVIAVDTSTSPGNILRDTVIVEIQCSCAYTRLRLSILNPYTASVDTIRIALNDSLTLFAESQSSNDTTSWMTAAVSWSKSVNMKTRTSLPGTIASLWTVVPDTVGEGWITVGTTYSASDSVWVIFYDPSAVRDNIDKRLHLDSWSVFSDNGRVRILFPAQGTHSVKIYSLTGKMIASREVGPGDAVFQLPKGVYLVRTNNLLNGKADQGKIINK